MEFSPDISELEPYGLGAPEKQELHRRILTELTRHHYRACPEYQRILDMFGIDVTENMIHRHMPFLPVRLFKKLSLSSVDEHHVSKVLRSSGTGAHGQSQIFLDSATARRQTKVLVKIVQSFIGGRRLPLLVIDSPNLNKLRNDFNARSAAIRGFSIFGSDICFALNNDLELDYESVEKFLWQYQDEKILIFGFTYMVWTKFYKSLREKNIRLTLPHARIIHGGGWKKMETIAVDRNVFNQCLRDSCGIEFIHNYYGLVEQTGSIFLECEQGVLHSSVWSDITIRSAKLNACSIGESGLIQLNSLLPTSYPGHMVLTEDVGMLLGEDDCPCGRLGKYFRVIGRAENAELRGCSDVAYAA